MALIYERNFTRLVKLGIIKVNHDGSVRGIMKRGKSISGGYMDLAVERLPYLDGCSPNKNAYAISLAHYFKQNGDCCRDPEMVMFVYPSLKMVEAQTFEMSIPPVYSEVYHEGGTKVDLKAKKDHNSFLEVWLRNLIDQGHGGESWTR
jgi:uncharacterized protein YqiB (DUF1249 family)